MTEYKFIRDITEQVHAEMAAHAALLDPDDEADWEEEMGEDWQEIEIDGHPCTLHFGTYYCSVWCQGMGDIGFAINSEDAIREAAEKLRTKKGVTVS